MSSRATMAVLGFAGFVSGTSIRVAEPLLPKLADEFARTPAVAAVVITAFALAYGLFQLVHGPIGDRFGKLRTVSVALFLAGAASFACASASSLEALSVYRFLAGMTSGAVVLCTSFHHARNIEAIAGISIIWRRAVEGSLWGSTPGAAERSVRKYAVAFQSGA